MNNLLLLFLDRTVTIETSGVKVSGKLLGISESRNRPAHMPFIVIIETKEGRCLVRDWQVVTSGRL